MNRKWWGIVAGSFLVGAALIGVGFWQFKTKSFFENLTAEAIGLAFAVGIVIWLVEGKLLSQRERQQAIAEYRRQISEAIGPETSTLALEMAEVLAGDFEPRVDLHGPERGDWEQMEPLLRTIFKRAWEVYSKAPDSLGIADMDKSYVRGYFTACSSQVARIKQAINTKPEFKTSNVLLGLDYDLEHIEMQIERIDRLDLLSNPQARYTEMGEMGLHILEMLKNWEQVTARDRSN